MEEDPVVQEIPVYLAKNLENKLYVVCYPTHPMRDGSDNFTVLKSSFKPENQEFCFEITVDTENSTYDRSKGVQLALNAKKESKRNEAAYDSDMLDKTVLSSTKLTKDCSNYMIGIFQDNELHITPLSGILKMQPQLDYLEKGDKRAKDDAKAKGEDSDEEEENAAPVTVKFARHQSDHVKKFQEQSFQFYSKKRQGECCIHTKYVPMHGTQAHLTRLEMFCEIPGETVNSLHLSPQEYLNLLMADRQTSQPSTKSFDNIKTLSLQEKVTTIMKNARIMSFKNLRAMLPLEHSTTDVLSYLQKAAVLVQGNWVVKSDLIYPKDSTSSENGIPCDAICRARDYVLLCFTEHSYIKRDQLLSVVKLPLAEVNEIFEKLATKESTEGWKLIVSPDWEFCERYSELATRHQKLWETRKYLREPYAPQSQRRKSNRESQGSEQRCQTQRQRTRSEQTP